jgi:phenylacetate-CoA ligase
MEREQWLSPDELRANRIARLGELLVHAGTTVPFYEERFARAGFDPREFRDPSDLHCLPVLTKADIREAGDAMFSRECDRERLQPFMSGGSTGEPVTIYRDPAEFEISQATFRRLWHWYGFDIGDRIAALWGELREEESKGRLADRVRQFLMNKLFLNAYDLNRERLTAYAEELIRFRPKVMRGYVTPLLLFSKFLLEEKIDSIRPRVVVTGAEALFDPQRETIAAAFGCPVRNTYGGREASLLAAECPEEGRLHLFEDAVHFEFLRNGRPVAPGESGDVVVTDLKKRAMPLIRYRVEDLATPSDERCGCGRGLGLLERIDGRVQDVIVTRSGHVLPGEIFVHIHLDVPVIKYQAVQETPDSMRLLLVPDEGYDASVPRTLVERLRGFVDEDLEIEVEVVPSIPLTRGGKHRIVISKVEDRFHV